MKDHPPISRGRLVDARLHLLDRQLTDPSGDPIGTLDDIDVDGIAVGRRIDENSSAPAVSAIMTGHVLTTRILGGQPPRARFETVPWEHVADVGIVVSLTEDAVVSDARWREDWLREHVISRIPGGRHAAE